MPWSGSIAAAAALVLLILGAATGWRAAAGWGSSGPAVRVVPRTAEPPASRSRGPVAALLAPDPTRVLVDVVRGRERPRLVSLPAGARLTDLLALAGLPADLRVTGTTPVILPGARLILEAGDRATLTCMPAIRRLRLGLPLDLNADSAADLERLPGIGPVLAERIVADRARRGPFASVRALARVPGVGPVTVAAIRPLVAAAPDTRCGSARP